MDKDEFENMIPFSMLIKDIVANEELKKDYKSLNEKELKNFLENYYYPERVRVIEERLEKIANAMEVNLKNVKNSKGYYMIPEEEKEFIKRAYFCRDTPFAKKARGVKKGKITGKEREEEINSYAPVIAKKYGKEVSLEYTNHLRLVNHIVVKKKEDEVDLIFDNAVKKIKDTINKFSKQDYNFNEADTEYLFNKLFYEIKTHVDKSIECWSGIVEVFESLRVEELSKGVLYSNVTENKPRFATSEKVYKLAFGEYFEENCETIMLNLEKNENQK